MKEEFINEIYALRRILQRNLAPKKYNEELSIEHSTPKSKTLLEYLGGDKDGKKTEKIKIEKKMEKIESKGTTSDKVKNLLQVIGS